MESEYSSVGNHNLFNLRHDNTRFNYLNELREQFTKFENEVWNYNSLRPAEAFKIDLKLPLLLIETFTKLFRLWRDFDAFQNLIKADVFHQINNDMNTYFGSSMNNFEFYCDTCDKNIVIEKNNLNYSYELHSQNDYHQQVLNNFNHLICSPNLSNNKTNVFDNSDFKDDFNGYIEITKENRLKCNLCVKLLIDEQEAIHHITSWPHRLKEMQFSPDDTNYTIEIDGVYCCRLCRCKLPDSKHHQREHLETKTHKLMEKGQRILKENKSRVILLNDNGEFMCDLCNENGVDWNELLKHCQSHNHRKSLKTLKSTPSSIPAENDDYLALSKNGYECILCQKVLQECEVVKHKEDKKHIEKHLAILNDDVSSNTSLLDSSSESECYNEAFKNNDIYIEINLVEDDTEIFKCLLCNKTGKGLDNLDIHCLTPIHQKYKKHIEKVSKIFANSDINVDTESTITNIDDLYYCQVCDIVIEDEETVCSHVKDKQHIQLEQLQKILNENRMCISVLTEEAIKLYYCQLCTKSMEGDTNIISHGNSIKHRQLLNMVEALSRTR